MQNLEGAGQWSCTLSRQPEDEGVPMWRRPTKAELEAEKKKKEADEKRAREDEARREKEDEIIAQIEKDFWENNKKIADGTAPEVRCERRSGPGIPVAAPTLETCISDDDLDRLLKFLEDGNEVNLEPRSALPAADEEMMLKAQQLVEVLTASLNDDDKDATKKAIGAALDADMRKRRVQEEQEAIARGEDCELQRMFKEMHPEAEQAGDNDIEKNTTRDADRKQQEQEAAGQATQRAKAKVEETAEAARQEAAAESARHSVAKATAPDYAIETVDEDGATVRVVVRVQLPLVTSAGDIDAGVVDAQVLELDVPGVYSLRAALPVPIDEDQMSCRFDKKKKILTVKLPALG